MSVIRQREIVQYAASYFYQKGIEPSVNLETGEIEFIIPKGCSQDEFDTIMAELKEHIRKMLRRKDKK